MRYFLEIAYKGTHFKGWQIQPNGVTVQGELNKALSIITRQKIEITGSGRTDAGVHSSMQYAHFDVENTLSDQLVYKLNRFLDKDISIRRLIPVHDDAHARFDATSRSYVYRISKYKQVFDQDLYYWFNFPLDIEAMNAACELFLHYTDFESFSKVNTQVNTFNCTITNAYWEDSGDFLSFHITADRFLRGMVRTIVGTLLDIGQNKMNRNDLVGIIESKNRKKAGRAVPASGLFLNEVLYPYIS